ncbi:MAG: hypothetical protein PGN09_08680 [Sphingomonas fennica]
MPLAQTGLLLALAQGAVAAPPPTPLILDRGRADRVAPAAPPAATVPPAALPGDGIARVAAPAAAAATIRAIDYGIAEVPPAVTAAGAGFVGRPADGATLRALAQAVSTAFSTAGRALTTVAIPAQSLAGGRLRLSIAEGSVEAVEFPAGSNALLRAYGEHLIAERPLTSATFQRYLALMRDMPGMALTITTRAGRTPGGIVLVVQAKQDHLEAALGFDNRGTRLLGDGQASAQVHGNSLLRPGDRTDIVALAGSKPGRLLYGQIAHSTPIGGDGARATASIGRIRTRQRGSPVTGTALTASLGATKPLIRGPKRNLTLTVSLDVLDSDAAAFGLMLSRDHTRALRIAAGHVEIAGHTVVTASGTVSRGLDILGARGMADYTDLVFTKANGRVTIDRRFGQFSLRARAAGQWSEDRLAAAERFAVGGADFGRGFHQATLSGDRGFAGLAEIGWRPVARGAFAASELYAFVDGAQVTIEGRGPFATATYDLASAGAGVRLAMGRRAWLELEAARPIDDPWPGWPGGDWRFNIGWRLSLQE